jgi:hypothetical protein
MVHSVMYLDSGIWFAALITVLLSGQCVCAVEAAHGVVHPVGCVYAAVQFASSSIAVLCANVLLRNF